MEITFLYARLGYWNIMQAKMLQRLDHLTETAMINAVLLGNFEGLNHFLFMSFTTVAEDFHKYQ